jgi:hypothetical protein
MRRTLLIALSALVALCVTAAPALAVKSKQSMKVSVTSVQKNGMAKATKKRPANVSVVLHPSIAYDKTDNPFSTTQAVIFLDHALSFGGGKLPGCTAPQVLLATCKSNAKVGTGAVKALAAGLNEDLTATAYNGTDGRTLLVRIVGTKPLPINEVITGTFSRSNGTYGSKLTLDIPAGLQQPAPGAYATLLDFNIKVKGGNASSPLLGVSSCPKGGLKVGGTFHFTDGTFQRANTAAACKGR